VSPVARALLAAGGLALAVSLPLTWARVGPELPLPSDAGDLLGVLRTYTSRESTGWERFARLDGVVLVLALTCLALAAHGRAPQATGPLAVTLLGLGAALAATGALGADLRPGGFFLVPASGARLAAAGLVLALAGCAAALTRPPPS
jgi:hypothetical protein